MANKKKRCKCCGDYGEAAEGVQTPKGWFIDYSHAIKHSIELSRKRQERLLAKAVRAQAAEAKNAAKRDRERRMEVKPLSYWMKRAQSAVNAYIRARDAGKPCISCGKPDDGSHQRHASHYRSVGGHPELRFCELNIWASCSVCNNYLSGNLVPFRAALVAKIGLDKVEFLEGPHEPKRYRKEDYQAIEAEYKAKLKGIQRDS